MFIIYGFQSIDCSLTAENKSINTTKIKVRVVGDLEIKLLKEKKKQTTVSFQISPRAVLSVP